MSQKWLWVLLKCKCFFFLEGAVPEIYDEFSVFDELSCRFVIKAPSDCLVYRSWYWSSLSLVISPIMVVSSAY